jgi:hypothetical protein
VVCWRLSVAVGHFPLLVEDARPAEVDPSGSNQIDVPERKIVSIAVAAAIDALQRSIIGPGAGVALTGGTFLTNLPYEHHTHQLRVR